jgi:hypothetical protein
LTAAVPEPTFKAVHARRTGKRVSLSATVCDASPATITVAETDWRSSNGHRQNTMRHTWSSGAGPGCHAIAKSWRVGISGARSLALIAHDGDGVSSRPLRLSLR